MSMNPRIIAVIPLEDFKLELTFTNNEVKEFDMKPYLSYPVYEELKDASFFMKAKVMLGTVVWNDEIDMSPDTLYLDSKLIIPA
jgi:uncharacterized protein DUF2442